MCPNSAGCCICLYTYIHKYIPPGRQQIRVFRPPNILPFYDSGIHTRNVLRAFLSLSTIWNVALQAVCRLFYQISIWLLRWAHVPPGNPPAATYAIAYAGTDGESASTRPATPPVIIRSSSGNYHMFRSGTNAFNTPSNLGPQARRKSKGTYFQSIALVSSKQPIRRTAGRQQDIPAGSLQLEVARTVFARHRRVGRTWGCYRCTLLS